MKVRIDYDLCMGDGHCCEVCPEVFEYDDVQTEVHILMEDIPPEHEDAVRRAAEECDTGAVIIEE